MPVRTDSPSQAADADSTSFEYVSQWRGLVSTTNWEKGRIIGQWRASLRAGGAESLEWSDEAWSRRVGQVTPQHVGRLRRVYERFSAVRESYAGLYWSHFQVALDWTDAEMWLEGAVQNRWSVGEMRARRWETLGALSGERPRDDEVVESELDEDAGPLADATLSQVRDPGEDERLAANPRDSRHGDEAGGVQEGVPFDADPSEYPVATPDESVRPFVNLPDLPDDLAEAFEAFKLAILRHKLAGWHEISRNDLLASLDSLKQLALAPA
jgi:hypothetical protein